MIVAILLVKDVLEREQESIVDEDHIFYLVEREWECLLVSFLMLLQQLLKVDFGLVNFALFSFIDYCLDLE